LSHASPTAPGQLKSHYATKKPLIVGDINKNLLLYKGKKIGLLTFSSSYKINGCIEHILSFSENIEEAASHLFNAMRLLDQSDVEVILAEVFPNEGLGKAINDRLARASYPVKN
jgi:L-threonylcarbamoyladenylate synthase